MYQISECSRSFTALSCRESSRFWSILRILITGMLMISPLVLLSCLPVQCCLGRIERIIYLYFLTSMTADTSPRPNKRELSKKVPLHRQAVIPRHVARDVAAFQIHHA